VLWTASEIQLLSSSRPARRHHRCIRDREGERDHQGEDDVLRQIDLEGKKDAEILHRIANHLEGEVLVRVTSRLMKEMRTPTSSSGR
jgi:hypothetical protein